MILRYLYAMSQQGNVDELIGKPEAHALLNQPVLTEKIYGLIGMRPLILILLMRRPSIFSQHVHKSTDRGESWSIISPDLNYQRYDQANAA